MTTFCLSLLTYILLLVGIAKLPESAWDYLLEKGSLWLTLLKDRQKSLPFIGEIIRGRELLLAFGDYESKISLGIKILPLHLPRYKFYTALLEHLFQTNRTMGIGIKKFIPEIRNAVIADVQFEKKIADEMISALLQFMVIAGVTWSFVFLSSSMIDIPLSYLITLSMLALEFSGIAVFFLLMKKIKTKTFLPFNQAVEEIYLFSSFLDIGLSINEILLRSKILEGSLVNHRLFHGFSTRIKKLILRLKETGMTPKEETHEIIREIWHLQGEQFLKFTKIVQIMKFSILVFFFLPAYFLYLYSIFQFFMEQ